MIAASTPTPIRIGIIEDPSPASVSTDHEFAALLMTLSFFGSEELAASYLKEIGREDLKTEADRFRRVFPDALVEFARIARSIQDVLLKQAASATPPARPKVGRNDPCPCGSGRKYKKCCGSAV
jgi:uncharacterized protein YecA (UPF0149 family)